MLNGFGTQGDEKQCGWLAGTMNPFFAGTVKKACPRKGTQKMTTILFLFFQANEKGTGQNLWVMPT